MDTEARSAFDEWYRREHPRVLGSLVALSGDTHLAAEVTDEAFVRALARWPRVGAMASPSGWTYRVALNGLRRSHRRRGSEHGALQSVASGRSGLRAESDQQVRTGPDSVGFPEVWAAVRALPEKQRVAIVLRYVADLPEAEIATAMGVSRGTVASNLSDARKTLAAFLGDDPAVVTGDAETKSFQGSSESSGSTAEVTP